MKYSLLCRGFLLMVMATVCVPSFLVAQTSSTQPPPLAQQLPALSNADAAVLWAKSQCNGGFGGYVDYDNAKQELKAWTGKCARFVVNAYGVPRCQEGSAPHYGIS